MCISEATVELMLDLPTQSSADMYSLLMRDNSLETVLTPQLGLSAPSNVSPAQHSQIENTALAA